MKVVILASGKGIRLRPLTYNIPKSMVSIANKPLLEHIILGLKNNGFKDIVVVVGYLKEKIMKHFGDGSRFGVKIEYAFQEKPLGTANAIGSTEEKIGNEKFLVVTGDQLLDFLVVKKMIAEKDCDGVILARKVENPELYGVLQTKGKKVVKIIEKPKSFISNLVNIGVYIFPREIFRAIKETKISSRGEYEITDSIQILINKNFNFHYVLYEEYWFDVGTKKDLKRANVYMANSSRQISN